MFVRGAMHQDFADENHLTALVELLDVCIRVVVPVANDVPLPAQYAPSQLLPRDWVGSIVLCNGEIACYPHYTCFVAP